jgi:hypothetical protein
MYTFMEMPLESKLFFTVDNIFSTKVLNLLEPYAKLLPTDKSSYDVWPGQATNNKTAPECFTCDVLGKDRLVIIDELFNNINLPCYQKKWLKDCDIAVQKIPEGGFIPKHSDFCMFSLTVFLTECVGGEFCWWDENNNKILVAPMHNRGVFATYNSFYRGANHKVLEVKENLRITLQLFVFNKKSKEKISAIIEDDVNE